MLSEERCDEVVEETCFAVVAEGLSNAAKHAPKAAVEVRFEVVGGVATVAVADDGPGGAAIGAGSGLQGLRDRVEALGGRLEVSPGPARGTEVRTQMPATAPGSPSG